MNEKMYKELEDLSMVYRFVVSNDEVGVQSILVNNKMLERYGITAEQLHEHAMEIAPVEEPLVISELRDVLMAISNITIPFPEVEQDEEMMYVATNPSKNMGVGVITYPDFMETASEKMKGDFFLLPKIAECNSRIVKGISGRSKWKSNKNNGVSVLL